MNHTELAQGIEAMEAVAAVACRTPSVKTTTSGEPSSDITRRRSARVRLDSSTRDPSATERRSMGREVTQALAENSRKWSSFPASSTTFSAPNGASPRPVIRLPSGETVPMVRSSFSASRQQYTERYVARASDISASSSSPSRENDAIDTLPKTGSVRAAAQALGAAQVPGALARGSPLRTFRSSAARGSSSSMAAGDEQGFGNMERSTGALRRNGRGWWTRADREGIPMAIDDRGGDNELRPESTDSRVEDQRPEETTRVAEVRSVGPTPSGVTLSSTSKWVTAPVNPGCSTPFGAPPRRCFAAVHQRFPRVDPTDAV